ncbi:hypothetical protein [Flavobacterium johnsoniae]|uniref:Uncharacterized protein n=1 Tax=Flavobacterium johnsoniae TaxID=986 RepID=A0A1M5IGS7_FLAJO|nr:hypothetical protein [Flavobacterium johnsoniae]SHG27426.1 hypothetical protein SAMN05444388_10292 [Flavobacterium johnsoniae]
MTRIQYTEELVCDNATQKSAIIIVEMPNWNENANGLMLAEINYIAKDAVTGAETIIPGKSKVITISIEKYNQMFLATDSLIPDNLSPFEKSQLRKKLCLLVYVQNDFLEGTEKCIFNTDPEKWEAVL